MMYVTAVYLWRDSTLVLQEGTADVFLFGTIS
jgi:hypothetical protein